MDIKKTALKCQLSTFYLPPKWITMNVKNWKNNNIEVIFSKSNRTLILFIKLPSSFNSIDFIKRWAIKFVPKKFLKKWYFREDFPFEKHVCFVCVCLSLITRPSVYLSCLLLSGVICEKNSRVEHWHLTSQRRLIFHCFRAKIREVSEYGRYVSLMQHFSMRFNSCLWA